MTRRYFLLPLCLIALLATTGGAGQPDPFAAENKRTGPPLSPRSKLLAERLKLNATFTPAQAKPGEVVRLTIAGAPEKGFYTYPLTQRLADQLPGTIGQISFSDNGDLQSIWPIEETTPVLGKEKDGTLYLKHAGPFTWSQDVLVQPNAKPGSQAMTIRLKLMVCDKEGCLGPDAYPPLRASLEVLPGPAVALAAAVKERLQKPKPDVIVKNPEGFAVAPGAIADPTSNTSQGLLGLLGAAFSGAFLMLLTPCVFPMIPITVNFFIKQSEKEHHRPFVMASVYSGTIIALLTLVMLALGNVVIMLANDPWFNLALGAVLIFFALSLFGMYEIELPHFLARFTSAHEGQGGYLGTIFMALTFTITSFTCTGPFLAFMLAPVAGLQPPTHHLILAALVYSTTFAAPFFLLALFPGMLKQLPKSGSWLNAVKVTMGFLELGAALKFLANTDMAWFPGNPRLFTYDTVLCSWIALSFASGLYLIGSFRLPHDDPVEHIGVVRMIVASIFFGLAIYMTPALRSEKKPDGFVGESLVAFLPFKTHLDWHLDYIDAWHEAKSEKKLIFIDFTGVNCTNCRDNERNVFTRPEVLQELNKYVRVQLFTDSVPNPNLSAGEAAAQALRNSQWRDNLGDLTNPYYIILRPATDEPFDGGKLKGETLGKEKGTIFNVPSFVKLLQRPLQKQVVQAKE